MGNFILESSIRATLIAAGTGVALAILRVRDPQARRLAWMAVLVAMLTLPAWIALGPTIEIPVPSDVVELPAATAWIVDSEPIVQAPAGPALPPPLPEPRRSEWDWKSLALAAYVAVFAAMSIRLAMATLRVRALVQRATMVDGRLTSPECSAPITIGWFRPVVVLPVGWRDWPRDKLNAVLAHEGEHVRRRDPLMRWLALWNRCVFWFHPLAWWLDRKLSAISEDICDRAVLERGHASHDYSLYLIELARGVTRAEARLIICTATAGLDGRIHRILGGAPAPAATRTRLVATVTACLVVVVTFAACRIERQVQRAPGQPTMNELMHRRAAQSRKWEEERVAREKEASTLSPEQARSLDAQIRANPHDRMKLFTLVRHYQKKVDLDSLMALTLWHIEHRPEQPWPWNIHPAWSVSTYQKGKNLWLAQLKKPGASAAVYRNAARYFAGGDKPLAEETLLAGQKAHPQGNWASPLGELYAQTLLGSVGPLSAENVVRQRSIEQAQGPYANAVRAKLSASNDARLLAYTAQWLIAWHFRGDGTVDSSVLALARSYVDRALAIDPNNQLAAGIRDRLIDAEARQGIRRPMEEQTASQRMRILRNAFRPAKAKELLELARQNPSDPEYGNAIYHANLRLGEAALKRGDKREAVRHLLAAAEATPTSGLRNGYIDMTLARQLVDWGEREAVARFLERCAKFNHRGKDLAKWATEIRKGINPDLIPYRSVV